MKRLKVGWDFCAQNRAVAPVSPKEFAAKPRGSFSLFISSPLRFFPPENCCWYLSPFLSHSLTLSHTHAYKYTHTHSLSLSSSLNLPRFFITTVKQNESLFYILCLYLAMLCSFFTNLPTDTLFTSRP